MRFLERNCPIVLVIWIALLITVVVFKVFYSSMFDDANFSVEELMQGVQQNDSRLLEYIYGSQLYSPTIPRIVQANANSSLTIMENSLESNIRRITRDVLKVLKEKRDGFFLECRAFDGDTMSKTLTLESSYNWTGVLLEPDPYLFPKLLSKQRNAWLLNGCLSPDATAHSLDFLRRIKPKKSNDKIISDEEKDAKSVYLDTKGQLWKRLKIPCFPLFSITSALQVKTIDFLVLDTQGLELQVLLNIPWEEIKIQIISVNVQSIPEGVKGVKNFLESKGYQILSTIGNFYTFSQNKLLV